MSSDQTSASEALHRIISTLEPLDQNQRQRLLHAAHVFFDVPVTLANGDSVPTQTSTHAFGPDRPPFSADLKPSARDFISQKSPETDVERITCLAYYLYYFRDQTSFKTLDLAKLNTEAAQPKFSNTAFSASNALKTGYLAAAEGGLRQLSVAGDKFVEALPDREAARNAFKNARGRRAPKRAKR